jgi:hypothetical protein
MTSQSPIRIRNWPRVRRCVGVCRLALFPCHLHLCLATTLQDVRLELAKEEAAEAAKGCTSPHKVTLTTFLTTALDLEEQQYVTR